MKQDIKDELARDYDNAVANGNIELAENLEEKLLIESIADKIDSVLYSEPMQPTDLKKKVNETFNVPEKLFSKTIEIMLNRQEIYCDEELNFRLFRMRV